MLARKRSARTWLLRMVVAPPEMVTSAVVPVASATRLAHLHEPGLDLLVVGLVVAAEHEPGRGPVRDDVRGGAAFADDPVDARRRAELLAPQADRAEQHDQRVERVQAAPRIGRRVGLQAGEDDVVVLGREWVGLDVVAVARVKEQRRVDPGEEAVVDHDLLAAPPLLRRRTEEDDLARELVRDRRERDGRSHARRGHRVVPAAVSEARQGVVLGEDADARPVTAAAAGMDGPDRGREAARRMLDLEPVVAQDLGDPRRGLVLLEGRLRVGVDPMRQLEDLATGRFDGGGDAGLEVELGLGRSNGGQVGHGSSVGRLGSASDARGAMVAPLADQGLSVPPRASPPPRRRVPG